MPLIPIASVDDARIASYLDLRDKTLHVRDGKFIAEGELVVQRLLQSGYAVESVLVADGQIDRLKVPDDVPTYSAPRALIEAIAGYRFHRGVLACGFRPAPIDLPTLIPSAAERAKIVVCSAVRDSVNLGGILRNCAAFGVDLVVLGDRSADPLSRRVLRVSMAAVLKLNLYQSTHLEQDLIRLRDRFSIRLLATVLDPAAEPLVTASTPRRYGLLFGNELSGLDRSLCSKCDSRLAIPMRLQTDSLNVAVASGIFLYHFNHVANEGDAAR